MSSFFILLMSFNIKLFLREISAGIVNFIIFFIDIGLKGQQSRKKSGFRIYVDNLTRWIEFHH